jgi:hypothetical protein
MARAETSSRRFERIIDAFRPRRRDTSEFAERQLAGDEFERNRMRASTQLD